MLYEAVAIIDQKPQSSAEPVSYQLSHNMCYLWGTQTWSFSVLKIFKPSLPLSLFLKESLTSQQLACSLLRNRATARVGLKQTKYFRRRTLAGVTWIGRREPCSQDCDLSSFQSFLWERPWPELPWLLCHSHSNLCWELPLGGTKDVSLHLSVKQRAAVQNSSCGLPSCKWWFKILKVLPFTSCWKSTDLIWGFVQEF